MKIKYFRNYKEVSRQRFYSNLKKDIPDGLDYKQAEEQLKKGQEIKAGKDNSMNIYRIIGGIKQCQQK